jgi:asparagine synthase (glutamine-hydrolysing)
VLPEQVVQRVKSPYPSTQDPQYVGAIQAQAEELLGERGHAVFSLVDPSHVSEAVRQDPALIDDSARLGLERTLDLAMWLEDYRPRIDARVA